MKSGYESGYNFSRIDVQFFLYTVSSSFLKQVVQSTPMPRAPL